MTTIITTPDIGFAGFYYPDIQREVLLFLRRNREELGLTDENIFEVHVQIAKAFSLVGHLNNTRLDTVATELLVESLKLLESFKRLMRMVGIELASASPAVAEMMLTLSAATSSDQTDFVPELAEFSTESVPPLGYESLSAYDLDRTDQVGYAYGLEEAKSGVCSVSTSSPDIVERTSGDSFALADLNSHLFVPIGISGNGGEFRITEYIDTDHVRVVRVPGNGSPGFQTETGLAWSLKTFTADGSTNLNSSGPTFTPWTDVVAGDLMFIGHPHVFWSKMALIMDTFAASVTGVWEYFDDDLSVFNPSADPTDNFDGTLTFDLSVLLGTVDRTGAEIIVTYLPTGAQERVQSFYAGGINKGTSQTYFGQVSPSTDRAQYSVTADWLPLENQTDDTADLTADGDVTYDLPQSQTRKWQKTEVNQVEGYWLRYRVISVSTPTEPVLDEVDIDGDSQHMLITATQGETVGPEIIGSSDGSQFQEFILPSTPFIDDSETIEVDESGGGNWQEYTKVDNFLNSQATSRHYRREVDSTDEAKVIFGDGTNGKVPPSGTDNVRAAYRIGGDVDGNVSANTIVVNADGIPGVASVTNPRSAYGWRMKEGGTEADLERIKRDKPAEIRTRDRAVNEDDAPRLAINQFVNADGIKPVARAFAVEEGLGVKTIKLLVVGAGGTTLTAQEKGDLELYFNGDRYSRPPVSGKAVMNNKVYVFNYEPSSVIVQATVVWPGGNREAIQNQLLALLNPLALEIDGLTYVWDFGGSVSLSRIYSAIHDVDPAIEDVSSLTLNGTAASVILGANELPVSTATGISVNVVSSN